MVRVRVVYIILLFFVIKRFRLHLVVIKNINTISLSILWPRFNFSIVGSRVVARIMVKREVYRCAII